MTNAKSQIRIEQEDAEETRVLCNSVASCSIACSRCSHRCARRRRRSATSIRFTGRRICTRPNYGWPPVRRRATTRLAESPTVAATSAHCRISVGDGRRAAARSSIAMTSVGLVLTCSHLFDSSATQHRRRVSQTAVSSPRGSSIAIERTIWRRCRFVGPNVEPLSVSENEPDGSAVGVRLRSRRPVPRRARQRGRASHCRRRDVSVADDRRRGASGRQRRRRAQRARPSWSASCGASATGMTYATCGRPVREFLGRVSGRDRRAVGESQAPPSPARDSASQSPDSIGRRGSNEIDARLRALDDEEARQRRLPAAGRFEWLSRARTTRQNLDAARCAQSQPKSKVELESLRARLSRVRRRVGRVAAGRSNADRRSEAGTLRGLVDWAS